MSSTGDVAERLTMPLAEAMETQRAVRRLLPDPVDDDTLLRCLELATRAPSGGNRQGWEFVAVRDPDVKHQLARLYRQAWAVYRRVNTRRYESDPARERVAAAVQWQVDHFEEVPVVVVACLRRSRPVVVPVLQASFYGSIYPAVQNLLLAARAVGLGATLTTLPVWSTTLVRRTLGLPRTVTPVAAVPLGWPKGHYGPNTRRPVGEVVHIDRYGNQPFRR